MQINTQTFPDRKFPQVVIADFGNFQIAIPTTTKTVKKRILSAWIPIKERIYHSQGWLVCDGQLVAYIRGLEVGSVFSDKSPFKPIQRLSPGIPVSFNTEAASSLPPQVLSQSTFASQVTGDIYPYCAVFHNIVPRFVAISSLKAGNSLLEKVAQTLEAEKLFVLQNYERLKRVPFYRQRFGLDRATITPEHETTLKFIL